MSDSDNKKKKDRETYNKLKGTVEDHYGKIPTLIKTDDDRQWLAKAKEYFKAIKDGSKIEDLKDDYEILGLKFLEKIFDKYKTAEGFYLKLDERAKSPDPNPNSESTKGLINRLLLYSNTMKSLGTIYNDNSGDSGPLKLPNPEDHRNRYTSKKKKESKKKDGNEMDVDTGVVDDNNNANSRTNNGKRNQKKKKPSQTTVTQDLSTKYEKYLNLLQSGDKTKRRVDMYFGGALDVLNTTVTNPGFQAEGSMGAYISEYYKALSVYDVMISDGRIGKQYPSFKKQADEIMIKSDRLYSKFIMNFLLAKEITHPLKGSTWRFATNSARERVLFYMMQSNYIKDHLKQYYEILVKRIERHIKTQVKSEVPFKKASLSDIGVATLTTIDLTRLMQAIRFLNRSEDATKYGISPVGQGEVKSRRPLKVKLRYYENTSPTNKQYTGIIATGSDNKTGFLYKDGNILKAASIKFGKDEVDIGGNVAVKAIEDQIKGRVVKGVDATGLEITPKYRVAMHYEVIDGIVYICPFIVKIMSNPLTKVITEPSKNPGVGFIVQDSVYYRTSIIQSEDKKPTTLKVMTIASTGAVETQLAKNINKIGGVGVDNETMGISGIIGRILYNTIKDLKLRQRSISIDLDRFGDIPTKNQKSTITITLELRGVTYSLDSLLGKKVDESSRGYSTILRAIETDGSQYNDLRDIQTTERVALMYKLLALYSNFSQLKILHNQFKNITTIKFNVKTIATNKRKRTRSDDRKIPDKKKKK